MSEETIDNAKAVAEAEPAPKKAKKKPVTKVATKKADVQWWDADKNKMGDLREVFHLLGDSTRIKILHLCDGQKSVAEISKLVGSSQPAVSHHIALLRGGRLIGRNRVAKSNLYFPTEIGTASLKCIAMLAEQI